MTGSKSYSTKCNDGAVTLYLRWDGESGWWKLWHDSLLVERGEGVDEEQLVANGKNAMALYIGSIAERSAAS